MKEKTQIISAEKIFDFAQDYIILAKAQRKLKNSELVERQLNELAEEIKNLVEDL